MERNNSFDILRIAAALLVVFSHSFVLTGTDPLEAINPQISIGRIGLAIFFVLSGYLVFQSWERSNNFKGYLKKRALRIWPGLSVAAVAGVAAGAAITDIALQDYFFSSETILYPIKTVLLLTINQDLPGVLNGVPYPQNQINAPLWTLPIEFIAYLILVPIALLLKRFGITGLHTLGIISLIGISYYSLTTPTDVFAITESQAVWLLLLFTLGIALNSIKDISSLWLGVALLLTPLILTPAAPVVIAIQVSILIMSVGQKKTGLAQTVSGKIGDPSYGLYIFSFLVQQLLVFFFIGIGPLPLFLLATAITFPIAIMSWRLIEKPALKLKGPALKRE